jgi:hypothetical protein
VVVLLVYVAKHKFDWPRRFSSQKGVVGINRYILKIGPRFFGAKQIAAEAFELHLSRPLDVEHDVEADLEIAVASRGRVGAAVGLAAADVPPPPAAACHFAGEQFPNIIWPEIGCSQFFLACAAYFLLFLLGNCKFIGTYEFLKT